MVAVAERVKLERIHQMAGMPPAGYMTWADFASSIPFFEGVNPEELTAGDPNPVFMTFDILYIGAKSRNGLLYDEALVSSITGQLPGKGAKFGHSEWDSNGTPEDDADWVGLVQIGNVVYAKLYVPQGKARDQLIRMKRRNARIKTSFEGYGVSVPIFDDQGNDTGTFRLKDFELGAIDLVRDIDAALADYQSGEPIFSSETTRQKEISMPEITLKDVPEDVRAQIIAEAQLKADAASIQETKKALETALEQVKTLSSELADRETKLAASAVALEAASARIQKFEADAFQTETEAHIATYFQNWKVTTETGKKTLASLKETFKTLVAARTPTTLDAVKEAAESVWNSTMKLVAEGAMRGLAGNDAIVTGKSTGEKSALDALLKEYEGRYTPVGRN